MKKGVSVIICCYNSAARITETLYHLAAQKVEKGFAWEIILVDNASVDDTCATVQNVWEQYAHIAPLKIVKEPIPGLANARKKGVEESSFQFLIFCDDDNWLHPLYIINTVTILEGNTQIAACGGTGTPVFETGSGPGWFSNFAEAYATGPQNNNVDNGAILCLYGAGLAVRKQSLLDLSKSGFQPVMTGRTGKALSSAEDTELTYAFVLAGYKLHFSDNLQFQHFITKERLTWQYLKKLFTAFGTDGPVRNIYYAAVTNREFHRLIFFWPFHLLLAITRLIKYLIVPPKKGGRIIYLKWSIAYIKQLFAIAPHYRKLVNNILNIKKIKKDPAITNRHVAVKMAS